MLELFCCKIFKRRSKLHCIDFTLVVYFLSCTAAYTMMVDNDYGDDVGIVDLECKF